MKQSGKDLVAEFRALAPKRPHISIQRWSVRRIGLTIGVLLVGLIALSTAISNFRGAGLSPPQDATTSAYSAVGQEPQCRVSNSLILEAQSVPSATLVPCIEALPAGWGFSGLDIVDGRSRIFLDSDRAGFRAVNITLSASCNVEGASEVQTDEPGTRRYERVFPREDLFSGVRYYVYEGGCTTYEFELTGEGRAGLTAEAAVAMSFLTREEIETEVFEDSHLRL